MSGLTAGDIWTMLKRRHDKDVIMQEVSTGTSGKRDYGRVDAWAMRCSYTKPMSWGYEIKVSRQDFLRDDKWPVYMSICRQFYFACPHGLIQPEELPAECGLLWASKNGGRFTTKRKAVTRDVHPPEDFWMSMIMNRFRAGDGEEPWLARRKRSFSLQDFLDDENQRKKLGKRINDERLKQIADDQYDRRSIEARLAAYDELIPLLRELGLGPEQDDRTWRLRPDAILKTIFKKADLRGLENLRTIAMQASRAQDALKDAEAWAINLEATIERVMRQPDTG